MKETKCYECSSGNSFNEHGYCMKCGTKQTETDCSCSWPTGTWLQQRRAILLKSEADELLHKLPKV